jgi:hypothetical protein
MPASMVFIMVRSAPPEKVGLPEVNTTPLTASSATNRSTSASSCSSAAWVKTFIDRSVMSQVTSAMPSPSTSTV